MSEDLLEAAVAQRRLSRVEPTSGTVDRAAPRRAFTVARDEAVMRVRRQIEPGWAWTVQLLRAVVVASADAVMRVERDDPDGADRQRTVPESTTIITAKGLPAAFGRVELSGLLYAALDPDLGGHDDDPRPARLARMRQRLGSAINGALAGEPAWIELVTEAGARRWERAEEATERPDPYVERLLAERTEAGRLIVRVPLRTGWSRALGALFGADRDPVAAIDRLWHEAVVGLAADQDVATGVSLAASSARGSIRLGEHATWVRDPSAAHVWLVRERVRIAKLDAALARANLDVAALGGTVQCASLRLSGVVWSFDAIDDAQVVDDEALELLVAWLHDALAHADTDGNVQWPESPSSLALASGDDVGLDAVLGSDDLVFVWRHAAADVPAELARRVLALWPSEHRWLRRQHPKLPLVPLRALGRSPSVRRADLTDVGQGSLPPIPIDVAPLTDLSELPSLRLRVTAYVHRYRVADRGLAIVLAYGRRIGFASDPKVVMGGVTVVIDVESEGDDKIALGLDALVGDREALDRVVEHAMTQVRAARGRLVDAVMNAVGPHEAVDVPLVAALLRETTAWTLGLRYVERDGALVLSWDATSLEAIVVGHTLDGDACTLGDALVRARDVGGVVVGEPDRRWHTLESDDAAHRPWVLEAGRDILARVLGTDALWVMPVVPEAQPHVRPIADQPYLRLADVEVARLRQRAATEPRVRAALLAHVLAIAAVGRPDADLEALPLLRRYDPRALTRARLVSLASVRASATKPGLVPVTAVSRRLSAPVLEVTPAIAALLHEVEGLQPATQVIERSRGGIAVASTPDRVPIRDARGSDAPLVSVPIVDRLGVGALRLDPAPTGEGIVLWARGLRVGDFRLPTPLRDVTGRVWLTDAGIVAGHGGIYALALAAGHELARLAVRTRLLTSPDSARRRALEQFIEQCHAAVRDGTDRAGIATVVGTPVGEAPPTPALPQALQSGLALVVRHALQQPAMIETAWLSWAPARLEDATWPWRARIGRRHPWIRRALADDATPQQVALAAALVVNELLVQASRSPSDRWQALQRVLAR